VLTMVSEQVTPDAAGAGAGVQLPG
jgi:hypothetical protein